MIYKHTKQIEFETSPYFRDPKNNVPIKAEQCIFLDIETAPAYSSYEGMSKEMQARWDEKVEKWIKYSESSKSKIIDAVFKEFDNSNKNVIPDNVLYEIYRKNMETKPKDLYLESASLYPEYGKIICISIASIKDGELNTISFVGEEQKLLTDFLFGVQMTYKRLSFNYSDIWVVGHNVGFFDIPYMVKRLNINGFSIPDFLHKAFQQPWNKKIIDTATEWRVGNTTGDATLETIALSIGIPTSKDHVVNGSTMASYYYSDACDINKIVSYCEDDVRCQYELFKHLQNLKSVKI